MIIGVDVGAYVTKGVIMKGRSIIKSISTPTEDPIESTSRTIKILLENTGAKDAVSIVAVTGGGSRRLGEKIGDISVVKVDELQAIGIGGLTLAEKLEGLIVNVGTGTAMVAAYNEGRRVTHVGGTGVGGGTLLGLSERMLGIRRFEELEAAAGKGRAERVDLTVRDIVGGPIGIVPAEATASNFGRLCAEATVEDVAAGLFNMVCQVIGVLGAMAAKAYRLEDGVIVTGGLPRSRLAAGIIEETMSLFGINPVIPKDCEYCTAVGAARSLRILSSNRMDV
ncbi:MAG: pantothenate kinase [Candidatus Bathyarchaeota archaeon B63]|nr:MAG: pantothenate kinase [Candidatus Bathyarchaeota archaeon B63]